MRKSIPIILCLVAACAPQDRPDGRQAFLADCAACHGRDAKGNGPAAVAMGVVAPDLTTLSARNGGVFPRDAVRSIIDGFERDPHFSSAMPEFGAGDMGDTVIVEEDGLPVPVPARLLELSDYLESIQG